MATKSVDKPSKKAPAAKAKPDKNAVAKTKDAAARRTAPTVSKQASRPAAPANAKSPAAKPAAAPKPPAPKLAAAKAAPAKSKAPATPSKAPSAKAPAAKQSVAKKPEVKKSAAATKPADKKAPTKKPAKPTPESAKSKAAPTKAAAPSKAPAKTVVEKKSDVKAATKSSVAPPVDMSGKKPGGKTTKSGGGAKTMTESPAMKKPLVGQKPRSDRPASMSLGSPLAFMPKVSQPVNESSVKSSPASQEAKLDFKVNDHVVYPAHGVGRIVGVERQVIAGIVNELFLIDFEQEKMKLRVPTAKAKAVGMRALSDPTLVKKAVETLKGRARIKRTMWSRRAQEYEAKINSGDIISVAEVVRDLFRASDQPEQSYSERQLFEAAIDRLAREVAAVRKTDLAAALTELEGALQQKKAA
jgi:CarD family transcriptional regulator